MEKKKKKKEKKTPQKHTFPNDLIVEILLRLPVGSLLRFKSVCKCWLSLISDPQFVESYLDLVNPRLLIPPTRFGSIQSIDVDSSLINELVTVSLPLPPPSVPNFNSLVIMGSCRGLLLFNYEACGDLIVWNPSIRVHKTILYPYYGYFYEHLCGFGYDASTDDYIVIIVELSDLDLGMHDWPTEMDIFSFKANTWNHVLVPDVHYKDMGYEFRAGSLLNGALHWLVLGFYGGRKVPVIIAVDLAERTLSEIALPLVLTDESKYEIYSLRILRDCLSVCCFNRVDGTDDIWMMKEYKVQSSWTKSLVLSGFQFPNNRFSPICITKDGGILGSNVGGRLEKFSSEGELLEHLTFTGIEWLYSGNPQLAMYRESPLSLPSNLGEVRQHAQQGWATKMRL